MTSIFPIFIYIFGPILSYMIFNNARTTIFHSN